MDRGQPWELNVLTVPTDGLQTFLDAALANACAAQAEPHAAALGAGATTTTVMTTPTSPSNTGSSVTTNRWRPAMVPPDWLPLEPGLEISVRTDKVSIEYRRWLRDLAFDALSGPTAFAHALGITGGEAALGIDGTTR